MHITERVYIKQSGKMVFWRLGALGGSFYYSTNRASKIRRQVRKIRHNLAKRELRAKARNGQWYYRAWLASFNH